MSADRPEKLRGLCTLADPADLPRFDADEVWKRISAGFAFVASAGLAVERLQEAIGNVLQKRLSETEWDFIYLVAHAQCRSSARFASIALLGSDGKSRYLTGNYLAELIPQPRIKAVILQAADEQSFCFDQIASTFVEHGVPVVVTVPWLDEAAQREFAWILGRAFLEGATPGQLRTGLAAQLSTRFRPRLFSRDDNTPIFPKTDAFRSSVRDGAPATEPAATKPKPELKQPPWQVELEAKRRDGIFDVFLCHHSIDKPAVIQISRKLETYAIHSWLDQRELRPGAFWRLELEKQMSTVPSAAVFIGPSGVGPWQEQEISVFLSECLARGVPLIPVLLPNAPSQPLLPPFLRNLACVDFGVTEPDPISQLVWGITGKKPPVQSEGS